MVSSVFILNIPETGKLVKIGVTTTTNEEGTTSTTLEPTITSTTETTAMISTTTTEGETGGETTTTSTTIPLGDPLCEDLGCPEGTNFVASKNSDLYHYCHCSHAKRIKPENLVCFFSEEEAIEEGYTQSSCQQTTTTTSTTTSSTTSSTTTTETTTTSTTVTTTSSTTTTEESTSTTTSTTTTSTITTTSTVPPSEHIVFSEVLYDTPGKESDEEWIELYNPTSDSVDLSGLTIEDNTKSYSISNGTMILPGEFLVIARDETAFYGLYGFYPGLGDFTLSLNNDGDQLTLKDHSSSEIDFVAWEGGYEGAYPSWDAKVDEGESIQRDPPTQDTDTANDWISHAVSSPGN